MTNRGDHETREEILERLTSFPYGASREEAERRVADEDLWLLDPELRCGLGGEDAVEEWQEALSFAEALANGFSMAPVGSATLHLPWDATVRAQEALRRAEERAGVEESCEA
jgi:hypothetical protein